MKYATLTTLFLTLAAIATPASAYANGALQLRSTDHSNPEPAATAAAFLPESTQLLNPFQLASLAHRGGFSVYGVPGYTDLTQAYQLGQLSVEDVVEAAITAGYLTEDVLEDSAYLTAADNQLGGIVNRY